jgi:hypothetical protein
MDSQVIPMKQPPSSAVRLNRFQRRFGNNIVLNDLDFEIV